MTENRKLRALLAETRASVHLILDIDALQGWACEVVDDAPPVDDVLRDLRQRIDAALAEPVVDYQRERDEARASHQRDREGWDKTAERMETLMKSLAASRDEARAEVERLNSFGEQRCEEIQRCHRLLAQSEADWGAFRQEYDKCKTEVERLRERLQFDPGGSDKIDEMEDAVKYLRAEVDHWKGAAREYAEGQDDARAEVERLRAELDEKSGYLAAVEGLIPYKDYISDKTCAENVEVVLRSAYQRGAQAMREAAILAVADDYYHQAIRDLPVPEDKP